MRWEIEPPAYDMVLSSQKNGRAHDVTMFIVAEDGRLALIRKPIFPKGAFRVPSGGVEPGEDIIEGAKREALEETGLTIEISHYLLRLNMTFFCDKGEIEWTTHVFYSKVLDGVLKTRDSHEIAETRYATMDEMMGPIRDILVSTKTRLLEYRVFLQGEAVKIIRELKLI